METLALAAALLALAPAVPPAAGGATLPQDVEPPWSCRADPRCERSGSLAATFDRDSGRALEICRCSGRWFAILSRRASDGSRVLLAFLPLPVGPTERWTDDCTSPPGPERLVLGVVDVRDCEAPGPPAAAWLVDVEAPAFRPVDVRQTTCHVPVPPDGDCRDALDFHFGCPDGR